MKPAKKTKTGRCLKKGREIAHQVMRANPETWAQELMDRGVYQRNIKLAAKLSQIRKKGDAKKQGLAYSMSKFEAAAREMVMSQIEKNIGLESLPTNQELPSDFNLFDPGNK